MEPIPSSALVSFIQSDHTFHPSVPGDSRSPCPALNALSNHAYLPRNGRNITVRLLVHALTDVYNISTPMALVLSAVAVIKCGNRWSLDLHELAKHGVIEHDGSLVHADAPKGCPFAPSAVDPTLLHQLVSICDSYMTLQDFARARALRDATLHAPLDSLHAQIARGEAVLTLAVFGDRGFRDKLGDEERLQDDDERAIPKAYIEQWFGEDRLPDGWHRPSKKVGLISVTLKTLQIKKMIRNIEAARQSARS
ncbi:uncharacterized protein FIBRA_01434 [Fibroporia radiculosa]|uniref:Heme haloperoxidase family profile domain-containing protein n=1 Tax=Fibroporia radiculosa TaxID=599839 RepID=J4I8H4_9APHY|nr:uncharacterized protein FIBRA_01434 [Fibroporia radiculosa]CCL99416.1 predicted protein [Fibroporia radiculosa]